MGVTRLAATGEEPKTSQTFLGIFSDDFPDFPPLVIRGRSVTQWPGTHIIQLST